MRFLPYSPDQAYLLPPSVKDILSDEHLCFFLHRVVEQLDLSGFEREYVEEGPPAHAPALMVKVWLYAYALGVTSSRRLEQRVREDLAFRYLAGGASPDHWTLNEFRRHHRRAINDLFTQVLEWARAAGLGRLGHVAVDSTRVAANASRNRVESEDALRRERAKLRCQVRRWQQQCDAADPNETPGTRLEAKEKQAVEARLAEIPRRLEKLRKTGLRKRSRTDPDSRFLRERQGFTLGYTVSMAVSEDHVILEQRVTQEATDNASLLPVVEAVEGRCRETPQKVSADCGFFSLENLKGLEARGIEGYVPDSNLAHELKGQGRRHHAGRLRHPEQQRMRRRLRSPSGRAVYQRRKAIVEPVFGVLKEQRGMRRFRLRGLAKVGVEMALAATAYNLTRLWSRERAAA
jgi:transposase/IS5 family transposase